MSDYKSVSAEPLQDVPGEGAGFRTVVQHKGQKKNYADSHSAE